MLQPQIGQIAPHNFRDGRDDEEQEGFGEVHAVILVQTACISSSFRYYLDDVGDVPLYGRTEMRPWKAAVGVGAACAACCAIPLFGGAAALTAGSAAIAAIGASIAACADEFAVIGAVLLVLALGGGLMAWRRRRSASGNSQVSPCSEACNVK